MVNLPNQLLSLYSSATIFLSPSVTLDRDTEWHTVRTPRRLSTSVRNTGGGAGGEGEGMERDRGGGGEGEEERGEDQGRGKEGKGGERQREEGGWGSREEGGRGEGGGERSGSRVRKFVWDPGRSEKLVQRV